MKMLVLLMLSSAVFAQTKTTKPTPKPTPPLRSATVSGRVFLITKAGDIKPARMASVYAFFSHTMPKQGETPSEETARHSQDGRTAIYEWLEQDLAAAQANSKFFAEQENIQCTHKLMSYLQALGNTVEWAKTNDKLAQIVQTEADEEGNFQLTIPRPGVWDFFAHGHAGFNDAFWGGPGGNFLIVELGTAYTMKLSSPETACLAME